MTILLHKFEKYVIDNNIETKIKNMLYVTIVVIFLMKYVIFNINGGCCYE